MRDGFPERVSRPALHVDRGGTNAGGETTYLLLHGLGATGAVWRDVARRIETEGAGRWLAPDLRGQGASDWADGYGMGEQAADVAILLRDAGRLVIIGHSKGALVGMLLASGWFGVKPAALVIVGCKAKFTDEEFARVMAFTEKPLRWFENRADAEERYLKASGLWGICEADDPRAARGVAEGKGGFRLAADPLASVPGGDIGPYVANVRCPSLMATGSEDPIAPPGPIKEIRPDTVVIDGAPHNAHVTHADAVWALTRNLEKSIDG